MKKNGGEPIPNALRVINDFSIRGKETPVTNMIRAFIEKNPNCSISDIYKGFPDRDSASIRRIIRKMVESHSVVQRFSI